MNRRYVGPLSTTGRTAAPDECRFCGRLKDDPDCCQNRKRSHSADAAVRARKRNDAAYNRYAEQTTDPDSIVAWCRQNAIDTSPEVAAALERFEARAAAAAACPEADALEAMADALEADAADIEREVTAAGPVGLLALRLTALGFDVADITIRLATALGAVTPNISPRTERPVATAALPPRRGLRPPLPRVSIFGTSARPAAPPFTAATVRGAVVASIRALGRGVRRLGCAVAGCMRRIEADADRHIARNH